MARFKTLTEEQARLNQRAATIKYVTNNNLGRAIVNKTDLEFLKEESIKNKISVSKLVSKMVKMYIGSEEV